MTFIATLAAGIVVTGCGSSATKPQLHSSRDFTTGYAVGRAIDSQLTDTKGNPIAASCPDQRLLQGNSIICKVAFVDGSFHNIRVRVIGFKPNGNPNIHISLS